MARARLIKPRFFTNDDLAEISPLGRLLFIALWTIADREGRLEYRPKRIKVDCLPYDNCNIEELISHLQKMEFLSIYQVENNQYIQITNFTKHQNPHVREQASEIPGPEQGTTKAVTSNSLGDDEPGLNPLTLTLNPLTLNSNPESFLGEKNAAHSRPDEGDNSKNAGADTGALVRTVLPRSADSPLDIGQSVDFENFRAEYPIKTHRREAMVAYGAAVNSGAKHKQIMDGVERLKKSIERGDTAYPFNPGKWLDDHGWENDYKPKTPEAPATRRDGSRPAERLCPRTGLPLRGEQF